jgi:hypothetical protein
MKNFPRFQKYQKLAIASSICIVAATAGILGNASSDANLESLNNLVALDNEVKFSEENLTENEQSFLDTLGTTEEEAEQSLKSLQEKSSFTYTESGGLSTPFAFCYRFIDSAGNFGPYGKVISNYLSVKYEKNRSTEMLAEDLVGAVEQPQVCPNWRSFDKKEKIKFWVWTFSAISAIESGCGASKIGMTKGVQGTVATWKTNKKGKKVPASYLHAIGLLQLEKEYRQRKTRNLDSCNVSDIVNSVNNLRCGLDIMEKHISSVSPNKNPWPIYRGAGMEPHSYWLRLREVNGGPIGKMIRAYAPCRSKSFLYPKFKSFVDPAFDQK